MMTLQQAVAKRQAEIEAEAQLRELHRQLAEQAKREREAEIERLFVTWLAEEEGILSDASEWSAIEISYPTTSPAGGGFDGQYSVQRCIPGEFGNVRLNGYFSVSEAGKLYRGQLDAGAWRWIVQQDRSHWSGHATLADAYLASGGDREPAPALTE